VETINQGVTTATITPERGGTVVAFAIGDRDILYPEREVRENGVLKRRGGIPILFPNGGALFDQPSNWHLGQHGFARDRIWEVLEKTSNSLSLGLVSDQESMAIFPFSFELQMKVAVKEGELTQQLLIKNTGDKEMPIAPGLHPYFLIKVAEKKRLKTTIPGFDPTQFSWDETLSFPGLPMIQLEMVDGTITLRFSENFKRTMIWSQPDKDQLCLEPWVGEVGAILDPHQVKLIAPHQKEVFSMTIAWQPNLKKS